MKRVVRVVDFEKKANVLLNEWLEEHPDAELIDIKPIMTDAHITFIYAIVDIPEKENK